MKTRFDLLKQEKDERLAAIDKEITAVQTKYPEAAAKKLIEELSSRKAMIEGAYARSLEREQVRIDQKVIAETRKAEELAKRISNTAQKAEQHLKTPALTAYLLNGGTASDFEAEWPEIKKRLLIEKVIEDSKNRGGGIRL